MASSHGEEEQATMVLNLMQAQTLPGWWPTKPAAYTSAEAGRVPLTGPSAVMPDLAKENYKVPKQFP